MLWNLFQDYERLGDREALVSSTSSTSWQQLSRLSRQARSELESCEKKRIGLLFRADALGLSALAALDPLAADTFLLSTDANESDICRVASDFKLSAIISTSEGRWRISPACQSALASSESSVTILTSGTTGKPKAARHTWESLARPVRRSTEDDPQRWLLTYRPRFYAGLQVVLQAMINGGTLVVPELDLDPNGVVSLMIAKSVEYVSATPSYWRRLLLSANPTELTSVPLRQITIGGEAVDQPLLNRLRSAFPNTRIVHIYASTEMGRCFSVADGQAGFPREYLERELPGNISLRIVDGQLYVRSSNSMHGYDELSEDAHGSRKINDWFRTGDLVRVEDDRVCFLGRDSELINVGGNKVNPLTVEEALRNLPEIADVRVFGQKSSITGQIVACQIVPASGIPGEIARQAVLAASNQRLDRFQQPRMITIVDQIESNSAGKTQRA